MTLITLKPGNYRYDPAQKAIHISEKGIPFATDYSVLNSQTGSQKEFTFSHSTGPEFDPTTRWVYKSSDGLTLEVHNDAQMTQLAAQSYLKAKLR
jgi:hypothetical protein